jgi:hypothetical protein
VVKDANWTRHIYGFWNMSMWRLLFRNSNPKQSSWAWMWEVVLRVGGSCCGVWRIFHPSVVHQLSFGGKDTVSCFRVMIAVAAASHSQGSPACVLLGLLEHIAGLQLRCI